MSAAKTMKLLGEVSIAALDAESTGPAKFDVTAYTGAAIDLQGYDHPVVVDLAGMNRGRSLVANLDHDRTKRVGTVTEYTNNGTSLQLGGVASAVTPYREEVIASAREGFTWQASIEASDNGREFVKAGKKVSVNGREFTGPLTVVRKSTLKGFAFVSHGADDETAVRIAASAASTSKEKNMDQGFKTWLEARNWSDDLSAEQLEILQASYDRENGKKTVKADSGDDILAAAKKERDRKKKIAAITAEALADHPNFLEVIERLHNNAIEAGTDPKDYELEILRAAKVDTGLFKPRGSFKDAKMNSKVVEAALAVHGRLENIDKHFDDQTLQAAHDHFKNGIGLKQVLLLGARANGYDNSLSNSYTIEAQRAAFNLTPNGAQIQASGFSTMSIPGILGNTANKFLIEGWMAVDQAWRSIAAIRSVSDFKTVTSYSLTGAFEYEQVGPGGELKHGTVGEETYTNKADTYGKMFAITRQDIINDDLGALTMVPKRIGHGAGLKLNDIFWTEFLNNTGSFFHTNNSNVSTGGGSALGIAGLTAAELVFLNQTDPNSKPLGLMPSILLVPPALKRTALGLMNSQLVVSTTTANTPLPDGNTFSGNYRVESSPYMSNASYTGYSAAAWYLLANPSELATIEVCFLNGKDAPTVDSADADFNVLGVQMRGYIDAGVNLQEPRAGVRSNGS